MSSYPLTSASTMSRICSTRRARRDRRWGGDHTSCGRHESDSDDPGHRLAGPKSTRRQLVTALSRHGFVDDRISGGVRRTLHPHVAYGVHTAPAAVDQGIVGRIAWRPCGDSRAELRLRIHRTAGHAGGRRGYRSEQGGAHRRSEPVSIEAIDKFNRAFAPHGLPATAFKPSYGIAEATLFVSTIAPDASATVVHLDRDQLAAGRAVPVTADAPSAVAHVSCGQVARSQWAVIVNPDTGAELPDGRVGEIWLHGDNVGRGYHGRPLRIASDVRCHAHVAARCGQPCGRLTGAV